MAGGTTGKESARRTTQTPGRASSWNWNAQRRKETLRIELEITLFQKRN